MENVSIVGSGNRSCCTCAGYSRFCIPFPHWPRHPHMVRNSSFRTSFGLMHLIASLAAAGMVFLMAGPALAQPLGDRDQSSQRYERPGGQERPTNSPTNLPSWAEPSTPESGGAGGVATPEGVQTKDAPSLPGDPQQVPVDGGLALLAAAGAGYAVRKLGESDEDEEELP